MKKHYGFIKIIAFLFSVLLSFPYIFCVSVQAKEAFPDTSGAKFIYLYSFEANEVIFSKGEELERIAPASTTKIMSGLLAINRLNGRLDEYVTITDEMLKGVEGFSLDLKMGDMLKIEDLLYCLICGGGNDAAVIIANICSGSTEGFVDEMNALALEYGMQNTVYTNPTGIDDSQMYTCLNDTVILSKKAIENEYFLKMAGASNYSFQSKDSQSVRTISNRNALISAFSAIGYQNKKVKGLNAGMTERGGYCVSAYATDGQDSYLCIVMGGKQDSKGEITSYTITNNLLKYMFDGFTYTMIAQKGDVIGKLIVELALPIGGNEAVYVNCVLGNDIYALAPKNIDYKKELTYKTFYHTDPLIAPVYENTVVGGVDIYYQESYIASERLLVTDNIDDSRLLTVLDKMKKITLSRKVLIFLIILIPSLIMYLYLAFWRKKIKRRKALKNQLKKRFIHSNTNKK